MVAIESRFGFFYRCNNFIYLFLNFCIYCFFIYLVSVNNLILISNFLGIIGICTSCICS